MPCGVNHWLLWGGAGLGILGSCLYLIQSQLFSYSEFAGLYGPFALAGLGGGLSAVGAATGRSAWLRAMVATVAVLFPVWGMLVGAAGCYVLSPIVCSLAWAWVLGMLFGHYAALPLVVLGGCVTVLQVLGLAVLEFTGGWVPVSRANGIGLVLPMALWHAGHPFALLHAARSHALHAQGYDRCLRCGYDVRGLPADVCPECGRRLAHVSLRPAADSTRSV
ncbi:MAG: hypothetical protein ACF8Q5_10270 [Phycisphaerales bacterium JB040]